MTIKDLAAQTGYSVGTVSRVLNNQPHVSDLAREIILKAAEESGFQLNENARQLKQQQSNSLLVVCKGRSNELFDALLLGTLSIINMWHMDWLLTLLSLIPMAFLFASATLVVKCSVNYSPSSCLFPLSFIQ